MVSQVALSLFLDGDQMALQAYLAGDRGERAGNALLRAIWARVSPLWRPYQPLLCQNSSMYVFGISHKRALASKKIATAKAARRTGTACSMGTFHVVCNKQQLPELRAVSESRSNPGMVTGGY
jgi:hypothetical protein